jgi:hypothetical protein
VDDRHGRAECRRGSGLWPIRSIEQPEVARKLASWWITFYLTSMGPLYANLLRDLGFENAVVAVLAANKSLDTAGMPEFAEVLIDELTVSGSAEIARAGVDRWYAAGAEMPVVVLPPNRSVEELDHALEALRPA